MWVEFIQMLSWRDELRRYIHSSVERQLTDECEAAQQPAWIQTGLRPHQLTLLAAARALEQKASITSISLDQPQLLTRYGVLADRVGSGKSLVALAMVREPPVPHATFTLKEGGAARILGLRHMPAVESFKPQWADLSGSELWPQLFTSNSKTFYTSTALAIVPHNVIQQWDAYIKDQTHLKACIIKKTKDCDYERAGFHRDILTADIVVVSCTMLKKFIGAMCFHGGAFSQFVWSRLFLDEADTLTCTLRAGDVVSRFTWFITGSWLNMLFPNGVPTYTMANLPEDVQKMSGNGTIAGVLSRYNIVSTYTSDSRDPRFTELVIRNSDAWIDTSLKRPLITHEDIVCRAPANLGILQDFISPAALEALHAGDSAGAMAALGLKSASKESLVARVTASLRSDIVQAQKILAFKRDIEYSTASAKDAAVQRAEVRVATLESQLVSLEARIAEAASQACPICYDAPNTATLTPCCRQTFCLSCLCECIKTKPACPLCRTPIRSVKDLLVIGQEEDGAATVTKETQLATKGAALLKLLTESTGDQRFLVFSAHEASFKGLKEMLGARGIECEMFFGSAARIEKLRSRFQEGAVRVLCMNARHVGAGINLEAATHVVLYHRMNTELERQVIGRAVRFERAEELRVIHLVHEQETAFNGSQSSEVILHV